MGLPSSLNVDVPVNSPTAAHLTNILKLLKDTLQTVSLFFELYHFSCFTPLNEDGGTEYLDKARVSFAGKGL